MDATEEKDSAAVTIHITAREDLRLTRAAAKIGLCRSEFILDAVRDAIQKAESMTWRRPEPLPKGPPSEC